MSAEKTISDLIREIDWMAVGYALGRIERDINVDQDLKTNVSSAKKQISKLLCLLATQPDEWEPVRKNGFLIGEVLNTRTGEIRK